MTEITLPDELAHRLRRRAEEYGLDLNDYAVARLTAYVEAADANFEEFCAAIARAVVGETKDFIPLEASESSDRWGIRNCT
jgi:hypothetical protein